MHTRCLRRFITSAATSLLLLPGHSWAASAGLPWETPLQKLIESISGPVAKAVGVLAVTMFGLMLAFSDGAGLRWAMGILFGLAIAFAATTFVASFFSFGGGAVW
jgi:type IV secretion system protein VirB2